MEPLVCDKFINTSKLLCTSDVCVKSKSLVLGYQFTSYNCFTIATDFLSVCNFFIIHFSRLYYLSHTKYVILTSLATSNLLCVSFISPIFHYFFIYSSIIIQFFFVTYSSLRYSTYPRNVIGLL